MPVYHEYPVDRTTSEERANVRVGGVGGGGGEMIFKTYKGSA